MQQLIAQQMAWTGDAKLLEIKTGITSEVPEEKFYLLKLALHLDSIYPDNLPAHEAIQQILNL